MNILSDQTIEATKRAAMITTATMKGSATKKERGGKITSVDEGITWWLTSVVVPPALASLPRLLIGLALPPLCIARWATKLTGRLTDDGVGPTLDWRGALLSAVGVQTCYGAYRQPAAALGRGASTRWTQDEKAHAPGVGRIHGLVVHRKAL